MHRYLSSIWIFGLLFLISLSYVYAASPIQNRIYYNATLLAHFDQLNIGVDNSSYANNQGTVYGVDFNYSSTSKKVGAGSAMSVTVSNHIDFNDSSNRFDPSTSNFSCFMWINGTKPVNYDMIVSRTASPYAGGYWWFMQLNGASENTIRLRYMMDATNSCTAEVTLSSYYSTTNWEFLGFSINTTGSTTSCYIYYNGTVKASGTYPLSLAFVSGIQLSVGRGGDGTAGLHGYQGIDELVCVNYSMTSDEMNWSYNFTNNGNLIAPSPSVSSDITPPIVNTTFNATSFFVRTSINFTGNVTDETALNNGFIINNASGVISKTNFSLSGASGQMSIIYTFTTAGVFNFSMIANDTSANMRTNDTIITIIQASINETTSLNNSNPKINDGINITANINSTTTLSTCSFYDNQSLSNGAFTILNKTITNIKDQCSQNYTIRLVRGNLINFSVVVYDVLGDVNFSQQLITVANTFPPSAIIFNSSDKNYDKNITINITPVTDVDNDVVNYLWYSDISMGKQTLVQNSTSTSWTTNWTSDGIWYVNVTTWDAFNFSIPVNIWNGTLDTTLPVQSSCNTPNGTFTNKNISNSCACTDTNLFEQNVTATSISTNSIVFSNTTTNLTPTYTTYIAGMTINTTWGDGSYNISHWCGDTKNTNIPIIFVNAGFDSIRQQFNDTRNNLQINITYGIYLPNNAFYTIPENDFIFNKKSVINNILNKNGIVDYFNIGYNVTLPNLFALQLINSFLSYTNINFAIQIKANSNIAQVYDNLNSHLEIGSGKNTLSFDAQDLKDNGFNTYFIQQNQIWYLIIPPKNLTYSSGTQIVVDPRIDNLNVVQNDAIVIIDTTNPTFNSLNLSTTTLLGNNSFISAQILNFTFNVSDTNNNTVLAYVNGVKNISTGYISNLSKNFSITFTQNGNYTALIEINDSAGNKINGTYLLGFVVDTIAPTFVNAFNRTANSINSTNITTDTSVNISIFGLDDLYLDRGNFSDNASGSWVNHSITIRGNNTPYHYVIGNGNFTANQVVGWKFYVYDIAGNLLDPIYTFTVGTTSTSTPSSTPSSTPGGSDVSSSAQYLSNSGLNPVINGVCAQKEQVYDGKCYPCDPTNGYLKFNTDDRSVLCISCAEGFQYVNGNCIILPPKSIKNQLNEKIDYYARKISNFFGTDNLLVGYSVLGVASIIIMSYSWKSSRRKNG